MERPFVWTKTTPRASTKRARSEEILDVNIEDLDLDLAGRRCPGKAKAAQPKVRRRGASRADYVLETVFRDAGTARLVPRLLQGRTRGPVFVTRRRPGPGKAFSARDVCPDTGLARLSYGQARALLDQHTAYAGPGTGWDLHEYRHSPLTHLGERGTPELMLMAKWLCPREGAAIRDRLGRRTRPRSASQCSREPVLAHIPRLVTTRHGYWANGKRGACRWRVP